MENEKWKIDRCAMFSPEFSICHFPFFIFHYKQKRPSPAFAREGSLLNLLRLCYVFGLQTLGAAGHAKGHRFSLSQSPKSTHLDGRVMDKYIPTTGSLNKTISFGVIEPLHFPNFFFHGNPAPSCTLSDSRTSFVSYPAFHNLLKPPSFILDGRHRR